MKLVMSEPKQVGFIGDYSCGTIYGSWDSFPAGAQFGNQTLKNPAIGINDVFNREPRNGDFRQFMPILKAWCIARGYDLMFLDVMQPIKTHLLKKQGFSELPGSTHLIFYS